MVQPDRRQCAHPRLQVADDVQCVVQRPVAHGVHCDLHPVATRPLDGGEQVVVAERVHAVIIGVGVGVLRPRGAIGIGAVHEDLHAGDLYPPLPIVIGEVRQRPAGKRPAEIQAALDLQALPLGNAERGKWARDHGGEQIADPDDAPFEEVIVQPCQVHGLSRGVRGRDGGGHGVRCVGFDQQAVERAVGVASVAGAGWIRGILGDAGQCQRPSVADRGVTVTALDEHRLGRADQIKVVCGRSAALRILRFVVPEALDPGVAAAECGVRAELVDQGRQ